MPTLPLQRRKGLSTYAVRSSGDNKDPGHEIIYAYQRRERTPPDPRLPRTGLIEPPSAQRLSASTKTRRIARAGSPDDERDDPRRYRRERGPLPSCRLYRRGSSLSSSGDPARAIRLVFVDADKRCAEGGSINPVRGSRGSGGVRSRL